MGLGKQIKVKRKIKAAEAQGKMKALTGNDISHLKTGQQIRMGNKLDRQLMKDAKRDLKKVSSASKGSDKIEQLEIKKGTEAAKENVRQSYSQTAHDKINRIAEGVQHIQQESGRLKANMAFDKAAKEEILNIDDKKAKKRHHKELMQEQKGKHRKLKKKTDVNINVDSHDFEEGDTKIIENNVGRLGRKFLRPRSRRQDIRS
jgi:hypothetical protein